MLESSLAERQADLTELVASGQITQEQAAPAEAPAQQAAEKPAEAANLIWKQPSAPFKLPIFLKSCSYGA